VTPANVTNTVFNVGSTGATDTLRARLLQNDGTLTPWHQFTVKDPLTVPDDGILDLASAYAGTVNFAGPTGTLKLDHSSSFAGTVAGMGGHDTIDFVEIDPSKVQPPSYSGTAVGGTLTVTDVASSDGLGGTNLVDPPLSTSTPLTLAPSHA
jgi:hypothetical protein